MKTLIVLTLAVVVYGVMLQRLTNRIDVLKDRVDKQSVQIEMLHKMSNLERCVVAAAGDGETNDSPAIQEALDRAAKGGCKGNVVHLVPIGTYHLRSWLQFKGPQTINDGHGATIDGTGSASGETPE